MSTGTRVRGGAAAEQRLKDALDAIIEQASQQKRWGLQDPRLAVECAADILNIAADAKTLVAGELHEILIRRDKAADDDLRERVEALEDRCARLERGEKAPIEFKRKSAARRDGRGRFSS
jgi:hypothetical protein